MHDTLLLRICTQCDQSFSLGGSFSHIQKQWDVLESTHCPECRQQRRCAWRNDQNYYHNTCVLCQKSIISIYSPDKELPIVCKDCFWDDAFDPLSYGVPFSFDASFFEQYARQQKQIPRITIYNTLSENSDYTVHSAKNKNCYLGSSLMENENVYYSDWVHYSFDCMDCSFCTQMEGCYGCIDSQECYDSSHLEICGHVRDSFLSFDCRNGSHLIGCVGLRSKSNCILNESKTQKECQQIRKRLTTDASFYVDFLQKYEQLKASKPKRYAWLIQAENCVWDFISNCSDVSYGFHCARIEQGEHVYESFSGKDVYDVTRALGENLYECHGVIDLNTSAFCNLVYQSDHMLYSENCQNAHFSFGSISLKWHTHCFFNTAYSKHEYETLLDKVRQHMQSTGEWGEFFPIALSPFGYNETKAQELFPMTESEVRSKWWKWSTYTKDPPSGSKRIPAPRLPEDITQIPNDILDWYIESEKGGQLYRIIPQELLFYRTHELPVPHLSPSERHQERMGTKRGKILFTQNCSRCWDSIQTTRDPSLDEQVYCASCYQAEVY